MKNNELIYIGKFISTFGIKGELKVYTESDFKEYRFRKGAIIVIDKKQEVKVSSFRIHKNTVLITINDLYDINEIEHNVGAEIYAYKSDEPTLDEDEYYLDDLVGLDVYDEDENFVGIVDNFIEVPQGYILEILNNGKKTLIPFVDEFIIDITEDSLIVKVLEVC